MNSRSLRRVSFWRRTTLPCSSTPKRWKELLPKSMPSTLIFIVVRSVYLFTEDPHIGPTEAVWGAGRTIPLPEPHFVALTRLTN